MVGATIFGTGENDLHMGGRQPHAKPSLQPEHQNEDESRDYRRHCER